MRKRIELELRVGYKHDWTTKDFEALADARQEALSPAQMVAVVGPVFSQAELGAKSIQHQELVQCGIRALEKKVLQEEFISPRFPALLKGALGLIKNPKKDIETTALEKLLSLCQIALKFALAEDYETDRREAVRMCAQIVAHLLKEAKKPVWRRQLLKCAL